MKKILSILLVLGINQSFAQDEVENRSTRFVGELSGITKAGKPCELSIENNDVSGDGRFISVELQFFAKSKRNKTLEYQTSLADRPYDQAIERLRQESPDVFGYLFSDSTRGIFDNIKSTLYYNLKVSANGKIKGYKVTQTTRSLWSGKESDHKTKIECSFQ